MVERIATATAANPDRAEAHASVVRALEVLRELLGDTRAWESIEHSVRTGALQAGLLVVAEKGAQ